MSPNGRCQRKLPSAHPQTGLALSRNSNSKTATHPSTEETNLTNLTALYPELAEARANWPVSIASEALAGKNILVTGAGAGIGEALAKTCAWFGANVILLGRTRSALESVFDWIRANTQTDPVIVPCDLERLDGDTITALHDAIGEHYTQLHGLVHNAGLLGQRVPIAHYPLQDWQRVMQVNATAPFMLNQGLFTLLDHPEGSCIIHVSSGVGRTGKAYWGAYAASKFALEGLNQVLADETETAGQIRVYSVDPGRTRTKMRSAAYPLEDPQTLPIAEHHMGLFLYLLTGMSPSHEQGAQLDARVWEPPAS
ncbi:MAG TPA: YciK family oxidoreductase [Gammaproteobacteria bacterium]|mgnify:CR=1 FL=1|nr:YciK family oxidoreductase [Gammaproteobacteria bacterium]